MQNNLNYLSKQIPNFITVLCICSGLTSIRFSIIEKWEIAIFLIIIAGILDFFDGYFARKLKGGSNFGAELDSLSDFVSFGVAPSLLIYFWTLSTLDSLGWSIILFFSVCAALRLARFTADIYIVNKPIDSNTYFVGVPSPAAAGLILFPIFLHLEFDYDIFINPYLNLINLGFIGFLMISKIPTISFKKINFSIKYAPWFVLFSILVCIGLLSNIWLTLIVISGIYICSLFYTVFFSLNNK